MPLEGSQRGLGHGAPLPPPAEMLDAPGLCGAISEWLCRGLCRAVWPTGATPTERWGWPWPGTPASLGGQVSPQVLSRHISDSYQCASIYLNFSFDIFPFYKVCRNEHLIAKFLSTNVMISLRAV